MKNRAVRGAEGAQPELGEHLLGRGRVGIEVGARARHHHEPGEPGELARLAPGQQIEEGLRADEQEELAFRGQRGQSVHRVRRTGPAQLDVGDGEARMLVDGEGGHPIAMLDRRQLGGGLVGRLGRRHKKDPVEAERFTDVVGEKEVSEMDGVEGASEDADRGHRYRYSRTWPSPMTTNLVVVSSRTPTGPRACSRDVEIPISAPSPNWLPSTSRVEALTRTAAASTSRVKRRAATRSLVTIASARPVPNARMCVMAASRSSTTLIART